MDRPDFSRLRTLWRGALGLAEEFRQHWLRVRLSGLSAEIAFFALLGLFPAVIAFTAALGSLDVIIGAGAAADIRTWLLDWITTAFGADSTLHRTVADLFAGSNAGAVTVGAILTLYTASRGFVAVVRALDVVYDDEHRRRWLSTRVVGFTITVVTVVVFALMTAMVVIGPLLGGGDEVAERLGRGGGFATAWVWLRWPATFLVVVAWTASIYRFAPRRPTSWRQELPGAVVATVWWLVASSGFRVYLGVASGGMNTVFGVLGGALILLFWLYLLSMGLLVGAALNSLLARHRESRPSDRGALDPEAPPTPTGRPPSHTPDP